MFKIEFETRDMNSLVERTVERHIAGTLAMVTCPIHGAPLEAVRIGRDASGAMQLHMKGCCDAALAAANKALGVSETAASESGTDNETAMEDDTVTTDPRPLRAFICHASEDNALARDIATELHAAGIDTFFDEWEIKAGDSLRRKIDEGIEACTHFIVLLTTHSLPKPWVNAELDAAFVKRVEGYSILIPLRHQLGVDRLPPLLAALRSPELRDYEHDIGILINEIKV